MKENFSELPKILIGCPTYSEYFYCLDEWVKNIRAIDYPNFDIVLVDNSKSEEYKKRIEDLGVRCLKSDYDKSALIRIAKAREELHNYVLENNYDYLFSVEQDVFPDNDVLEKLLEARKDVIGAPFILSSDTSETRRRTDWILSFSDKNKKIITDDGHEVSFWYKESELLELEGDIFQVGNPSFGCTLIHRRVLEEINTRINPKVHRPDDSYFFEDCAEKDINVFVDLSLYKKVEHYKRMGSGFGWINVERD